MDWELIFWLAFGGACIICGLLALLPINWDYDPKGNDPYCYCPKEKN